MLNRCQHPTNVIEAIGTFDVTPVWRCHWPNWAWVTLANVCVRARVRLPVVCNCWRCRLCEIIWAEKLLIDSFISASLSFLLSLLLILHALHPCSLRLSTAVSACQCLKHNNSQQIKKGCWTEVVQNWGEKKGGHLTVDYFCGISALFRLGWNWSGNINFKKC